MVDDFSGYPKSVSEEKANREASAALWTPRDAIISVLRDIDSGELDITAVSIAFLHKTEAGGEKVGYSTSAPNTTTALGLLSRASFLINDA